MPGTTSRARRILFRVFYSTSFTIVFLLTIAFAFAGAIDALYQSYRRRRIIDLALIASLYILTGLLAIFLYASRLYTNRSILKDIPKTYMPIDRTELPVKRVWRLIEDCKSRSAVIAYQARPRSRRVEVELPYARARINTLLKPEHSKEYRIFEPQWGVIQHPGWSSPAAKEMPNLEYGAVIAELTDLIEARAVSLVPTDADAPLHEDGTPAADEYVIEALRRPDESGMRQYISQLVSLDVLDHNSLIVAFLTLYERARFAPEPLSEYEFTSLMRMFAEVLRTMKPLDPSRLDLPGNVDDQDDGNLAISALRHAHDQRQAHSGHTLASTSSSSSLADSLAGSVRHHRQPGTNHLPFFAIAPPRVSEDGARSIISFENYTDAEEDATWAETTSRPPFLRGKSSRSHTTRRSRHRGSVNRRRRTSRIRAAISRASLNTRPSTAASLRSAGRSEASVIRLDPDYDGSRDRLPFEYTRQGNGDSENDGSLRRSLASLR